MRERVTFEREIRALAERENEFEITDPTVWEVTVGQRIVLDLATTPLKGIVDTVQWSIPGRCIRTYDGTPFRADVFELPASDLAKQRLVFYWADAEDGRKVRARVKTTTGGQEDYVATFNVKGPTLESLTAGIRENRIETNRDMKGVRLGKLVRGSEGVWFKWSVKMPARRGGFVKDVQTVFGDRVQTLRLGGGGGTRRLVRRHPLKPALHEQLDGSSGGEAGYTNELWKVQHAAGASTGESGATDSPHSEVPPLLKELLVDQRFFYFIMFKPDLPNSIWVPVAKVQWSWKASVTQSGGRVNLTRTKQAKPIVSKSTTDFPKYTSNVEENEWVEPPE